MVYFQEKVQKNMILGQRALEQKRVGKNIEPHHEKTYLCGFVTM